MKTVSKLLLALAAAVAFSLAQPVAASPAPSGLPTTNRVPDGGSTISLLGFALLGVAALRRKLNRQAKFREEAEFDAAARMAHSSSTNAVNVMASSGANA